MVATRVVEAEVIRAVEEVIAKRSFVDVGEVKVRGGKGAQMARPSYFGEEMRAIEPIAGRFRFRVAQRFQCRGYAAQFSTALAPEVRANYGRAYAGLSGSGRS